MTLTQQQKQFFNIFGFLALPGVFRNEVEKLTREFDDLFVAHEADVVDWVHETHDNRMRRILTDATTRSAYLEGLLGDARICEIASELLGEGYAFRGSDCSIYDCGTQFHRDSYGADLSFTNIKMALYLDPLDAQSGAIRVIPGSHHPGSAFTRLLNQHVDSGFRDLNLDTDEVPATVLASQPGDLLLWNYRLMHATSYGGNQRRMLALEFSEPYAKDAPAALET